MATLSKQVAANTDDGQSGSGSGYSTSTNITLGGYFGTANGWWRFTGITIAPGSTINSAVFTAEKQPTAVGTADLLFAFVKEANPTYPTSGGDYDGRTLTTATATGSFSGSSGTFTSPSLVSALQEIVNQGTWASGNAVLLFIKDNNSNTNHGGFENRVTLKTFEQAGTLGQLDIDYTPAATTKQGAAKIHSLKLHRRRLAA